MDRGRAGRLLRGIDRLTRQLHAKGHTRRLAAASRLDGDERPRSRGKRLVTDGPFAETREQLGGYFLVDASDLDEAIDVAGHSGRPRGTVEIRPVLDRWPSGRR